MKKYFILFIIFFLNSCYNDRPEVRIVDSQGNLARINKIVPQFNQEQMQKQKEALKRTNFTEVNKFNNNYNQMNNDNYLISNKFIGENNDNSDNEQLPDDIFADRITNYKYINDDSFVKHNKVVQNKNINDLITEDMLDGEIVQENIIQVKNKNTKQTQPKVLNQNRESRIENISISKNLTNNNSSSSNKIKTTQTKISNNKEYYIQIGIYSKKSNADLAYKNYTKIHSGLIENYNIGQIKKFKVILGPYNNRKIAEKDLEKVINTGHYDVYITENK